MLKILIAFLLLLFIAILLWLVRKIDKTLTPKSDKHDEIKETLQRLTEEIAEKIAEKRTKIPIFSSETITHQEAEFADESLFALLPKWAKWLAFLLILLFFIIVFYYVQSSA